MLPNHENHPNRTKYPWDAEKHKIARAVVRLFNETFDFEGESAGFTQAYQSIFSQVMTLRFPDTDAGKAPFPLTIPHKEHAHV